MKKIIALLLSLITLLAFAPACSINKTEVSVLWSNYSAERALIGECDEFQATIADAFDRGAYIERLDHVDYDAKGNADTQITQIDEVINKGCSALVINPVDASTAKHAFDKAKEKQIPVLFLCSNVLIDIYLLTIISDYDKAIIVNVDIASRDEVLATKIAEDVIKNAYDSAKKPKKVKAFDRNGDKKITYLPLGLSSASVAEKVNAILQDTNKVNEIIEKTLKINATAEIVKDLSLECVDLGLLLLADTKTKIAGLFEDWSEDKAFPIELIISDDDAYVEDVLMTLRNVRKNEDGSVNEKGINYKELNTHSIPFYTVGIATNVSELLKHERPEEAAEGDIEEEELAAYSVMSTIDKGYVTAAALENDDEIAISAARILRNFIKGKDSLKDVKAEYYTDKNGNQTKNYITVPYTIYQAA
ncbi:MAG: substrate-binding domain-containing protein [Clostridia bacterium]|nr:substrate-binding domain-containing protein [Clostridia bacterium]